MPITVVSAEPIEGQIRREIAIVSSLGEHRRRATTSWCASPTRRGTSAWARRA